MRTPRCLPALGIGLSLLGAPRAGAQAVAELEAAQLLHPTVELLPVLADAHRVRAAHRLRRTGRTGLRMWRRPRSDSAP